MEGAEQGKHDHGHEAVEANKGVAGVDGMTVDELNGYLKLV